MKKYLFLFAVIVVGTGFRISDSADFLGLAKKRIELMLQTYSRAKLDLLFDQPKYSPGDTAVVRTLYLGAADLKMIAGRQVVFIQWYDEAGKVALEDHFVVKNGWSSNRIYIPANFSPGIYKLVAYTDWMKNSDSRLFFHEDFIVAGAKEFTQKTDTTIPLFSCFPEGGKLIQNVENHVVIRAANPGNDNPIALYDGDTEIARGTPDRNGLASFAFVPQPGKIYTAGSVDLSARRSAPLMATPDGFALNTTAENESIRINIAAPHAMIASGKSFFLLVINSEGLAYSSRLEFSDNATSIILPAGIREGIAQACIVDTDYKLWATRTLSIKDRQEYNVVFTKLKKTYNTRENAGVEVKVTDRLGRPAVGYITAGIVNQSLFDSTSVFRTSENLLLYSDIDGSFRMKANEPYSSTLQYLATQSCPWVKWNEIETGVIAKPRYNPEGSASLAGVATFAESGLPVTDSTRIMFFLQKQMVGYEQLVVKGGTFQFPLLFDFSGLDNVLYSAKRKGRDVTGITIKLADSDSNYHFKGSAVSVSSRNDAYASFTNQKRVIDKSYNFFTTRTGLRDTTVDLNDPIEKELGGADVVLNTKDFVVFPTMPELIREVLKSVDYRNVKGRDVVRVYTTKKLPNNNTSPLYIIDGVMTKEARDFIDLKPAEVITLKVVTNSNKLARWGILAENGAILVRTTRPDLAQTRVSSQNRFPIIGTAFPYINEINPAQSKNDRTPDFRASLKFDTNVILDSSGKAIIKFHASDDATVYRIQIDGMTDSGVPISKTETFTIQFQPEP